MRACVKFGKQNLPNIATSRRRLARFLHVRGNPVDALSTARPRSVLVSFFIYLGVGGLLAVSDLSVLLNVKIPHRDMPMRNIMPLEALRHYSHLIGWKV